MKHHKAPYNALSGCLEAYFGGQQYLSRSTKTETKYSEPEQGFRTVLFKELPLQLNYMRRRTNKPFLFLSGK